MPSRSRKLNKLRRRALCFDTLEPRLNMAFETFPSVSVLTSPANVDSNGSTEAGRTDVAMFPDGGFVSVFTQGSTILARRFDARKLPVGNQITVATPPSGSAYSSPRVAASDNGGFVVVFSEFDSSSDYDVFYRLYNSADGFVNGGQVNTADQTDDQDSPDVAMDSAGNFVVVFEDSFTDSDTDVRYRAYDATGTALGSALSVAGASGTKNDIRPSVAMSRDGSRIGISWQQVPVDPPRTAVVKLTIMSKSGSTIDVVSSDITVPDSGVGTNSQESPSVAADDDGDIAVAWIEDISGNERINKRTYSRTGLAGNQITVVPTATEIAHPSISVGRDAYREYAVAYENGSRVYVAGTFNGGTSTFNLPIDNGVNISRDPSSTFTGNSFIVGYTERNQGANTNNNKVVAFGRGSEAGKSGNDIGAYDSKSGDVWIGNTALQVPIPMFNNRVANFPTSTTWKDFLTGDFDKDGFDEVVGRDNKTGDWYLVNDSDTTIWTRWAPTAGWTDVQAADVNGDGRTDIIGRTSAGQWWGAISSGSAFTNVLLGFWSTAVTWNDVRVGDFDGDLSDDILARTNAGQWWMGRTNGAGTAVNITNVYMGYWSTAVPWVDIRVGDFDGDGDDDVMGRAYGAWWMGKSNGSSFTNELWGTWSNAVTWTDIFVSDFDLDGKDDIVARIANTGSWWLAKSNGSSFDTANWGGWSGGAWKNTQILDVNSDGRTDIISWDPATGGWWAGISTGKNFKPVYWGNWSTAINWTNVKGGSF